MARWLSLFFVVGTLAACGEGAVEAPDGEALAPAPGLTDQAQAHEACRPGELRWWRQSTGPGDEEVYELAVDRWENSILLGTYTGPADFGGGPLPATAEGRAGLFVAKYAPDGKHRWSIAYTPTLSLEAPSPWPYGMAVDRWGNITLIMTNPELRGPDGAVLPAGVTLLQLSPDGERRWSRLLSPYGEGSPSYGFTLTTDTLGNVILAGAIDGTFDFGGGPRDAAEVAILAKYTRTGRYLWDSLFPARDDHFSGVATDEHDNIYAAGFFSGTVVFGGKPYTSEGASAVLVSFKPSGAHRWTRVQEALGRFAHVAVHGNRVVVGGTLRRPVTFGGRTLTPSPAYEPGQGVLLAYTRDGEERWGRLVGFLTFEYAMDREDGVVVFGGALPGDDLGKGPLPGPPPSGADLIPFLARYDRVSGKAEWVRRAPLLLGHLATTRRGGIFLSRSFEGSLDIGGRTLTADRLDALLLRLCP